MTDQHLSPESETDTLRRELASTRAELAKVRKDLADIRRSFDHSPALIAIGHGPTHIINFANQAYLEVVAPGREIVGLPVSEALPELAEQGIIALLDGVYQTGEPYIGKEVRMDLDLHADGQLTSVYFDFVYQPTRDAEGAISGIYVHAIDVTDKVLARKVLQTENERIEAEVARRTCELASQMAFAERIIQNVPAAVAVLDRDLIYRVSNPTHSELLQLPADQIVGRHVFDVLPGGEDQIGPLFRHVLESGEPYRANGFSFTYRMSDGETRKTYWDFIFVPTSLGEDQEVNGVLALANEVSARIAEERDREVLQRRRIEALEQADRMKDEFVSMVSHELRSPMTAIRNAASILARGRAGAMSVDQQRFAGIIQMQSDRLIRLLDDLLDLQRLQTGALSYDCRPTDVREVATQVADEFAPLAAERGITVTTALGDTPLVARIDRNRLAQVLVNLLSNAVKFTPEGGTVTVRAGREGDRLRIDVEDTGVGIPETDLTRIFDKFVQLEASLQEGASGIGLGLAISRQIVEEGHRGRLLVTSEVGKGSCFTVELPSE